MPPAQVRTSDWILVVIQENAVIGRVQQMVQVSTTDGFSLVKILLDSPFSRPATEKAGVMVVPCSQPPIRTTGLVFGLEDAKINELHTEIKCEEYHFTLLK